jgi:chloride channel protein, CIC family
VRLLSDFRGSVLGRRVLDVGTLFVLSALVGIIAGLGAAAFHYLLQLSSHLFMDSLAGYRPPGPLGEAPLFHATARPFSRWVLLALPALGGLLSGVIVYWLAPEAEGHGTDAAIDAYHRRNGAIRTRVPFVKTIASAITMGTGGSAGREGPIAQIGAGLGSSLAVWLGLSVRQRRILMAAGLGAGIGAIFRAPLAGALFSAEVLYGEMDLEYEVIAPGILSSIVAYSTFGLIFGWQPLFKTPSFVFDNPLQLGLYLVLALVVALGGRIYAQVFYGVRDMFRGLRLPNWTKPAIGGVVVGLIGLIVPDALSTGFGAVQGAFRGEQAAALLFLIAGAKILTTAFTVGSGGSGGVFGPAVVIGGSLGGAVGQLFHRVAPALVPEPGAFAMVGMAGFFAAAAHVPISTVIMVSELTGNYQLLVPSMFVCMLGFLLVRQHSIYEKQLPSRADSPGHQREMMHTVLTRLRVDDVLALRKGRTVPPVGEATPLPVVLDTLAESGVSCLPVTSAAGELVGIITLEAAKYALGRAASLGQIVIAKDVALPPVTIRRGESVYAALRAMSKTGRDELLVVGKDGEPRATAVLTTGDLHAIYDELLDEVETSEPAATGLRAAIGRWRQRHAEAEAGANGYASGEEDANGTATDEAEDASEPPSAPLPEQGPDSRGRPGRGRG